MSRAVDYLALTASSDFEDYAGYAKSADGEKMVGFTLMDGVFKTYDFPGSKNTYFYALANNGTAAGYYEDSDGLSRGVLLVNGELHSFDYPNSVETEIYGISDVTGALTGNFTDASGVRRGFSGETIVEVPGALATYADYVNASGRIVGGYIDADGIPHAYVRTPDNRFVTIDVDNPEDQEYIFCMASAMPGFSLGAPKRWTAPDHLCRHSAPRGYGVAFPGQRQHQRMEYQPGRLCRWVLRHSGRPQTRVCRQARRRRPRTSARRRQLHL